jgi:hypothetical protein
MQITCSYSKFQKAVARTDVVEFVNIPLLQVVLSRKRAKSTVLLPGKTPSYFKRSDFINRAKQRELVGA